MDPPVELRRLRLRQAAGRHFIDVVIGVSPGAAVAQGHAAADAVESALERALPESDVVVHVEPVAEQDVRDRAQAAALSVPRVREVHNVTVVDLDGRPQISLHLKLPGELSLDEAHEVATAVERAIEEVVPDAVGPDAHRAAARDADGPRGGQRRARRDRRSGRARGDRVRPARRPLPRDGRRSRRSREHRARRDTPLAEAHARASAIEEQIRRERPELSDVVIHTEP